MTGPAAETPDAPPADRDAARLRVLFVVPHPIEGPSSRFRVYQFLPYLRAHGIDATVVPLLSSAMAPIVYRSGNLGGKVTVTLLAAARRLAHTLGAARYDLVYLLREAFPFGPPLLELAMQKLSGRLIFDFDDAIYVPSTAFANPLDRFRDWRKTDRLIARADHVVTGSRYLADYAARHAPDPSAISVLPTVVDADVLCPRPAARDPNRFTVGWIGTPRGTAYLHPLRPAIADVCQQVRGARFVFVGAEPFDCGGLPVEFRRWSLEREVADIQSFDAGLMPLADDEEARGKCGFKIIEYMSAGAPVVCSPVGANLEIVEQERTGLFAVEPGEWSTALVRLATDAGLRQRLAAAGRRRVEESYCLDVIAPRLLRVIEQVASRPAAAAADGGMVRFEGGGRRPT